MKRNISNIRKSIRYNRNFREGEVSINTIDLYYGANYHLDCPDWSNEKYIDTNDYEFWNEVENNVRKLVAEDNDLTEYLPGELKGKVTSVKLSFEEDENLKVHCEVVGSVNEIKDQLVEWVDGQMSDGWGEGFEQQELGSTTLYVCYDTTDTSSHPYVEFFDNRRDAEDYCDEQNEGYDEDEDFAPEYVYDETEVYATCSFWGRNTEPKVVINENNVTTTRNRNRYS